MCSYDLGRNFRLLAVLILLSAMHGCGGGGGGGGDDGRNIGDGGDNPPPPVETVTISTAETSYAPLESVEVSVTPNRTAYTVQVDLSGTGAFSPSSTVEMPALTGEDTVTFAAPFLPLLASTDVVLSDTVSIRLRRDSDGLLSNAVAISVETNAVAQQDERIPSALLDMIVRALLASDDFLAPQAATFRPGLLQDSAATLDLDITLLDQQADAILQALFGISVAATADVGTRSISGASPKSARRLSATADISGQPSAVNSPIQLQGFESAIGCLRTAISAFQFTTTFAADACFEEVRIGVRDELIPSISRIQSSAANISNSMTSLFGLGSRTFVGRYAEGLAANAAMTRYADKFAQYALRQPALGGSVEETVDYALGQLTSFGKSRIYRYATREFNGATRQLLGYVGAPGAFSEVVDLSAEQLAAVAEIESQLLDLDAVADRMTTFAEEYGGEPDEQQDSSIVNAPGLTPFEFDDNSSPADVCAEFPELGPAVIDLGFSSCEAYIAPFFDPVFFNDTIRPLLDLFDDYYAELEALGCLNDPQLPACESVLNQFAQLSNEFLSALLQYDSGVFSCSASYREFETASPQRRTCVWNSLIYDTPTGTCLPGSRRPNYDVGAASVCAYYSRDYFLADGSCRENYSEVFFLGQNRCRWSDLPAGRPAAYSLDLSTGATATIEQ